MTGCSVGAFSVEVAMDPQDELLLTFADQVLSDERRERLVCHCFDVGGMLQRRRLRSDNTKQECKR